MLSDTINSTIDVPLADDAREQLEVLRTIHARHDHVLDTARLLLEAAIAVADRTPLSAEQVTTAMLECVVAIAAEFEANNPPISSIVPEVGEPEQEMVAFAVGGQISPPRLGEEVDAALAHCAHLAYSRLGLEAEPA